MELLLDILGPLLKWLGLVFVFVMPVASLLTWAERRQSAMMQDRLGPNRANLAGKTSWIGQKKAPFRLIGILHFVADALKMMAKEDIVPAKAHKALFSLAPILALAPVLIAVAIVPFGPTVHWQNLLAVNSPMFDSWNAAADDGIRFQILQIDFGILFYFAILTVANYGATIAGWASYNKWALLGGLRASSQMMSYEVAMGLSLMGMFLITGTLEPGAMVDTQITGAVSSQAMAFAPGNPLNWGWAGFGHIELLPFTMFAFLLFFVACIAETKRGPFDLPEGEPEIIGYFVEYSGIRWGMFFLAEFIEIVFVSMIIVTVFFGGYHVPFLLEDGIHIFGWAAYLPHIVVVLLQLIAFSVKVVFFCCLQLAIRWTLPRFRPDQLMNLGWKKLLPLALFNLMLIALISLFVLN